MRKRITLTVQKDLALDAVLNQNDVDRAVVIAHPHPLYGGDMDNAVVSVIAKAYQQLGWTTLRFNFRGVGASQGRFDDGRGERRDVGAAVDYLKAAGCRRVDLAGYSFGAWVIALWSQGLVANDHRIFLIAPPTAFLSFAEVKTISGLCGVIAGSQDAFGPVGGIEAGLAAWRPGISLTLIKGADHFFSRHKKALLETLTRAIAQPPRVG